MSCNDKKNRLDLVNKISILILSHNIRDYSKNIKDIQKVYEELVLHEKMKKYFNLIFFNCVFLLCEINLYFIRSEDWVEL